MIALARFLFCGFSFVLLLGCELVSTRSDVSVDKIEPKKTPKESKGVLLARSETKTYKYGRFTVLVEDDGQKIVGGRFYPSDDLPLRASHAHVIFINYATKELAYYKRLDTGEYEPVIGYAVVTPGVDFLPKKVVRGVVTQIDTRPDWWPTVNIRRKHPDLPKGKIPYGHPQNAMGEAKFSIRWDVAGWDLMRIHGTNGYPEGNFWEVDTFGCTRLENKAIINLVDLLGPSAVKEGIEVVAFKI